MTFLFGILSNLFVYLMFSFYNKTWDPMNYSQDSVYWFGCLCGLFWIAAILWKSLVSDDKGPRYGDGL